MRILINLEHDTVKTYLDTPEIERDTVKHYPEFGSTSQLPIYFMRILIYPKLWYFTKKRNDVLHWRVTVLRKWIKLTSYQMKVLQINIYIATIQAKWTPWLTMDTMVFYCWPLTTMNSHVFPWFYESITMVDHVE